MQTISKYTYSFLGYQCLPYGCKKDIIFFLNKKPHLIFRK